ncbi:uncharacterized protein MELLADRAFT_72588 [Melampsora larici-populina 98AG31]|uniref:Protein SQS1 n=1 Tax=Melampsora larici-populina (strain 98AG31 / pathotype 3-4-7) TaxID=747676 RepID=F4RW77_MELLP|nr:uncharacterized protein MELLADRAFT_72588 [Melampsora larici-populina 98AG31]EGG03368.1 hypothetical protein MELLADRAFT_72588 [Melampsora larici-populina 98AG31]
MEAILGQMIEDESDDLSGEDGSERGLDDLSGEVEDLELLLQHEEAEAAVELAYGVSESEDLDSDNDDDLDEAIWGVDPQAARKAIKKAARATRKGKNKAKVSSGYMFTDALQKQWEADRKKKAAKKALREVARLTGEIKSKKMTKESKKESWEKTDLFNTHENIRYFIENSLDQKSLRLSPMSKKGRAKIHLVANLYGLKSHSSGKGKARATTVERTHYTRVWGVDLKKIQAILFGKSPPKGTQAYKDYQGEYNLRPIQGNNKDGTLVGQGASEIGQENVGFRLLAKMGWTKGDTMGSISSNNGLTAPLMAVVKNSKNGLGMTNFY